MISFWYTVSGSDAGDELEILLRHDQQETEIGSLPLTQRDWTYAGLSAEGTFTGTLAVILSAVQNASNPTTVYLDEVALLPGRCAADYAIYLPLAVRK